jgi:hypothetical protein
MTKPTPEQWSQAATAMHSKPVILTPVMQLAESIVLPDVASTSQPAANTLSEAELREIRSAAEHVATAIQQIIQIIEKGVNQ